MNEYPSNLPQPSDQVVHMEHLSRYFGRKRALDDVNLSIPKGAVFGLVGENGAGKTTIIKHILGLLKAKQGRVRVFNLDPVKDPVSVLGRIGYLSEDRDMPDWMTIAQLMRYNQAFYDNGDKKWDAPYAKSLCEQFELNPKQKVRQLSRGQLARTGLVLALAHRPDLLILDEPSSGLDPLVRRDILTAIIRTVADEGRTVIFSSHLLDEVERVADWVAMIHQGRVVLSDPLVDVLQRHHRILLRYARPQASPPVLPGALSCHGEQSEWTVLCNGGSNAIKDAAIRSGAEILDESTPTLDEIFMARARVPRP